MTQIAIYPAKNSGNAVFITPLQLEAEIVFFDRPPFIAVVEFQLVEGGIPVQAEENRTDFAVAPQMVRFLLGFGKLKLVLLGGGRGVQAKEQQ
jgi:hypothetical protein